jgi:uncharacterized protein
MANPSTLDGETTALLKQFSQAMRHPEPASSNPRIAVYQRLFINNVRTMLASAFPVAHALLGAELWRVLVAHFYAQHSAQTPRFTELAPEFVGFLTTYLAQEDAAALPLPTQALLELLHYEWIETELMLQPDTAVNCAAGELVLSPYARPLAYQYAVHHISAAQLPAQAPAAPSYLVVWRNTDLLVKFQVLSLASLQLLLSLQTPQRIDIERAPAAQELLTRWQRDGILLTSAVSLGASNLAP